MLERTFIMVKPDGVRRGLVHEVIRRFEQRGYKLLGMEMKKASAELLDEHYAEHRGKPFVNGLISFMSSGPVVPMVWEGEDIIAQARKMMGATNPSNSDVGTLRGCYCTEVQENLVHGSDGPESSAREVKLWFPKL
eukprot:Trichotokara_eunicae@DN3756_c0_g1_i1.p1